MGLPGPLQPEMVVDCGGVGEGSLQDLIMMRSPLAFLTLTQQENVSHPPHLPSGKKIN